MNPSGGQQVRYHATYLCLAITVIALASLLSINDEDRVVVPAVDLHLPESCFSRQMLGVDCPGCGLTRGFISLMHGGWQRAWHYNPGVYPMFLLVVIQIPYRVIQVRRAQLGMTEKRCPRVVSASVFGIVAVFLVQWTVRMLS